MDIRLEVKNIYKIQIVYIMVVSSKQRYMIIYENSSIVAGIPLKQYLCDWIPQAKGFGRIGTHLI